ncbi:hypothetical protein OG780_14685 [Streptomyces sp. NBC_00386]|uniref:hypothetical protein n=1 Tax=Streptomyces sp. NBC_00386 TaxID=2975734 RepID=UPI002E211905
MVDEVQVPGSRGSETVFAQASRVRWRRRTAVTDPALHPVPDWGREFAAVLNLKDGRALHVRDSTGYRGKGRLGPLLKTPALPK